MTTSTRTRRGSSPPTTWAVRRPSGWPRTRAGRSIVRRLRAPPRCAARPRTTPEADTPQTGPYGSAGLRMSFARGAVMLGQHDDLLPGVGKPAFRARAAPGETAGARRGPGRGGPGDPVPAVCRLAVRPGRRANAPPPLAAQAPRGSCWSHRWRRARRLPRPQPQAGALANPMNVTRYRIYWQTIRSGRRAPGWPDTDGVAVARAVRPGPGRPLADPGSGRRRRGQPEDHLVPDRHRQPGTRGRPRLRPPRTQDPPAARRPRPARRDRVLLHPGQPGRPARRLRQLAAAHPRPRTGPDHHPGPGHHRPLRPPPRNQPPRSRGQAAAPGPGPARHLHQPRLPPPRRPGRPRAQHPV
jgi:hypothetical protein